MAKIGGYTEQRVAECQRALPEFSALSALPAFPAFSAFPALPPLSAFSAFSAFLLPAFSFSKCPNC
ncbi:MAG: hypothetical protein JOZ21_10165 [Verrucomicrobia bacterium]|nr:hypothetical protein [Verrucomicrobiota bacterium]